MKIYNKLPQYEKIRFEKELTSNAAIDTTTTTTTTLNDMTIVKITTVAKKMVRYDQSLYVSFS